MGDVLELREAVLLDEFFFMCSLVSPLEALYSTLGVEFGLGLFGFFVLSFSFSRLVAVFQNWSNLDALSEVVGQMMRLECLCAAYRVTMCSFSFDIFVVFFAISGV